MNSIGHDEDKEDKVFRSIESSIPNSFTYNTKSDQVRVAGGGSAGIEEHRLLETLEKRISQMDADNHQSVSTNEDPNKETPVFEHQSHAKKKQLEI